METFFDRMKWLIDKFGKGRPHTFAKNAMIPKSTMQKYISERIPSPDHLVRIHETFGVNLNWLLTGKGERIIGDTCIDKPKEDANGMDNPYLIGMEIGSIKTTLIRIERLLEEHINSHPTNRRSQNG